MNRCGCIEEDSQQTPSSPGIVEPQESIVFACVHPETAPERGVSMFQKTKLIKRDLSVCRGNHSRHSDLLCHVVEPQLTKKPAREYKGYYWATCREIRDIVAELTGKKHSDNRTVGAFCVVDDALGDYTAHAVIGFSRPDNDFWEKHNREAARGNLLVAVQRRGLHCPADPAADDCPGFANQSLSEPTRCSCLTTYFFGTWGGIQWLAQKIIRALIH